MTRSFFPHYLPLALLLAGTPFAVHAAEEITITAPARIGKPAEKVYRQVMPDGKIVYSDKLIKGAKLDETLAPDPAANTWKSESGKRPVIPPRVERTPVNKVPSIAALDRQRSFQDAQADVIKAEMLLEDAKKRQQAGIEPLPGERTGNAGGGSRLNEQYLARQQRLKEDVAEAEAMLRRARAERTALMPARDRKSGA